MKKNVFSFFPARESITKIILLMKLTTFLICAALMQVSAKSYSQGRISLHYNNISLEKLFDVIEKNSNYTFVYKKKLTDNAGKISVSLNEQALPDALTSILAPLELNYKILPNNLVVILPKGGVVQEITVRGKVTDKNGVALIGVTVKLDGANVGTTTDENGLYSINVPDQGKLVFSFVGFIARQVPVEGRAEINMVLEEASKGLNEVVVTAMGITRQKRSLSYAVSEVKAPEIMHAGAENIGSALVGKLPGVDFSGTASGPMGGTRINVRGINSIDGNSRPLIILDGIPVNDNDDGFSNRGSGGMAKGSLLNYINPDDIASITVLKGANAAALYGSQALNGVLVITTKKGNGGKKGIGVEVYSDYTHNQRAFMPEFQNEFGNGTTPYFTTFANGLPFYNATSNFNFGPRLDGRDVHWWDGQVRPWVAQPNNFRDMFRDGYTNTNRASVNSSSDKGFFRLSFTNFNYGGFLPQMEQHRNTISLSSGYQVASRLKVDVQVMYNDIRNQNPPQRIDRASNYPIPRNELPGLYEENYKDALGYYMTDSLRKISGNFRDNILRPLYWDQRENLYTADQQQLFGSVTATIDIAKPLSLRLRYGTDRYFNINQTKEKWLQASDPTNPSDLQGGFSRTIDNSYRNYAEALLSFTRDLGSDFKLSATAGTSMDDMYGYASTAYTRGLRFRDVFSLNNNKAADNNPPRGSEGGERYVAAFGTAQVSFREWLYMDVTARNDWSSKLPSRNRSYFYPSFGMSFILSEAVKLPEQVNYAKFRASYAQVGNTVPSRYFANEGYSYTSYLRPDGISAVGSSLNPSVPPLDIQAEKNYSTEFGLEAAFFDNRLSLDVTYYSNKGVDLINAVNVTPSSGATNIRINSGSISNKGLELQLKGDVVRGNNFTWQATLNASTIKRKVLSLADGIKERTIGNPFSAVFKAVPGDAPYDIYMNKLARDPKTNLPMVDANGLFRFETTLSKIGNALPKWYGGFVNDFSYKGFTLTAVIDYRLGGKIVSYSNVLMNAMGTSKQSLYGRDADYGGIAFYTNDAGKNIALQPGETPPAGKVLRNDGMLIEGIKPDGTPNDIIISAANYYNSRYNRFGTEDAVYDNNYFRLGEVSLAYRIPRHFTSKLAMQNLVVSFIARNVAYIYKSLPNVIPNSGLGTDAVNNNFEYTAYPSTRNLGVSLKANF